MSDRAMPRMGAIDWMLLVILSALWGGSFFFGKIALSELQPFTVVLGRVGFASVALIALVCATGSSMPRDWRTWRAFVIMGALNNLVPFSLILWGQTQIASGLASILNATTPLFAVVLAHFLTRDERLNGTRFAGVFAGLCGVAVMIGPEALTGFGANLPAQLACLAAAASYALAGIYGRRFRGIPPLVTAASQVTATTALILPIAMLMDRPFSASLSSQTWSALLGLALLSTALAYIVYFRLLASAGATNLMLVTFLIPVSAVLLGTIVLGESLSSGQFVGMALIAFGLAAIDGRPLAIARSSFVRRRRADPAC